MLKRIARAIIPDLAHRRWQWETQLRRFRLELSRLGWPAAAQMTCERLLPARGRGRIRSVSLTGYKYPIHYRVGASDPAVIRQLFVQRDYAIAAELPGVEFIIDCGANIGLSAFYFLHCYPRARVLVVEPDPGNMALCQRNLAAFGTRVIYVQSAVWSTGGPLKIERGTFRDGAEWSLQVRPPRDNEPADVIAVTMNDLIAASGFPRIDLLKVDIEAAEREVFAGEELPWLKLIRNLVIELHDEDCKRVVEQALARIIRQVAHSGDVTLFRDTTAPDALPCS